MERSKKTLLVVGAGGFIGGFICAEGLRRGYEVWAAVRATTSRKHLTDERIHFVELDYDDPGQVEDALEANAPTPHGWNCIIWNLGATKCANFGQFNLVNFLYLRTFVEILRRNALTPDKFLFVSSLSALGKGDEKDYTPMNSRSIPNPDTRYGLSKIKAETYLETLADFPWIIFRPTGVYGPHEKDYLMMVKSIEAHFDFAVGFRTQLLTFIYVDDLVNAMYDAIESDKTIHRKYIIAEGRAYTQKEFRSIVAEALNVKFVIPIKLPLWVAYAASVVAEKWGALRMKPSTLNRDKFKIMKQRNWNCDISDARADFGFNPKVDLREGIRRTVEAYLEEKQIAAIEKAFKGSPDDSTQKDASAHEEKGGER